MANRGLGKGVNAVFEDLSEQDSSQNLSNSENDLGIPQKILAPGISTDENGTLWAKVELLRPNPKQPRQFFNEDEMKELTESIRREGVLSPIIIEDAGDGTFFIIAGERRARAAKSAGLEKVPIQLRKYSDEKKLEIALVENIQRSDLNPLEEAQAYFDLMQSANLTQDQVADRVGKRRSTIANSLRLLKLPQDIQKAVIDGSITSGHARAILSLESDSDMRLLYARIVGQGLSVRQAEALTKEMKFPQKKLPPQGEFPQKNLDPNFRALESKIIERLGTKVQLKGNFDKGNITISYFSRNDLDRIFSIIAPESGL